VVAQSNWSALDSVSVAQARDRRQEREAAAKRENQTAAGQAAGRGRRRI